MLEMNDKKLCDLCFSEMTENGMCNVCHIWGADTAIDCLPAGTVLRGKYAVGKTLYRKDGYIGYLCYDMENDAKVLIRELYLSGFQRGENKKQVLGTEDSKIRNAYLLCADNFRMEGQIMSQFSADGTTASVVEMFSENGTCYMVCAFPHDGILLSDYIRVRGGALDETETANILSGIIPRLQALHSAGVLHRNICPEHIILSGKQLYLTGLLHGDVKVTDSAMEQLEETHPFAATEIFQGGGRNEGAWTDIYALGAMAYYMLTGKKIKDALSRVYEEEFEVNLEGYFGKMHPVLKCMLEVQREKRPQDLVSLCDLLRANNIANIRLNVPKKKPEKTPELLSVTEENPKKKKTPIIICLILAAILVIGGLVAGGILLFGGEKEEEQPPAPTASAVATESAPPAGETTPPAEETEEPAPEESAPGQTELPSFKPPEESEESPQDGETGGLAYTKNKMRAIAGGESVMGNSKYNRKNVISVEFLDSLENAPKSAWDISEQKDGSVKAWVKKTGFLGKQLKLFVAAENGVDGRDATNRLFDGYENATSIRLNGNLHTTFAENMSGMFRNCKKLKELDLTGVGTAAVTDMSSMFENCESMATLILPADFSTQNVTTMAHMFDNCRSLKAVDTSKFDTLKVTDMSYMFAYCSRLETLDLRTFNTFHVTNMERMFHKCGKLSDVKTDDEKIKEAFQKK